MTKVNQGIRGFLGTYFGLILFFSALVATFYFIVQGRAYWPSYFQSLVFFMGGIQGFWLGIAYLFFPAYSAKQIGWISNGFQTEMGATNLALGVTGVMSWWNPSWLMPIALIVAILSAGRAYARFKDILVNNNRTLANMYSTDLLVSVNLFFAIFMV